MALFIYGISQLPIGVNEFLIKCPCCEKYSWADIIVVSKYFHVWMLPIGPVDKEAIASCKECRLKRQVSLNKDLIDNYDEVKNNFKHPWFVYSGVKHSGFSTLVYSVFQ